VGLVVLCRRVVCELFAVQLVVELRRMCRFDSACVDVETAVFVTWTALLCVCIVCVVRSRFLCEFLASGCFAGFR